MANIIFARSQITPANFKALVTMVDRQTLIFFIIMFIFLSLPNGPDLPHSSKEREALLLFQESLKHTRQVASSSHYYDGYGNVTGLELSYDDLIQKKNVLEWPFHHFSREKPWLEDQKYSLLPNEVSNRVKQFWGTDPASWESSDTPGNAYLLNISGIAFGEFEQQSSKLVHYPMRLAPYLQEHLDKYTQSQYEDDKERYEQDPENNSPPRRPEIEPFPKVGNITYPSGKISLSLKSHNYNYKSSETAQFIYNKTSDAVEDAVLVSVKVNIYDHSESDTNEIDTVGVYFQKTGALLSVSKSAKFYGSQMLPHFAMSEENFKTAKILVGQYLNITNVDKDITLDDMNAYISRSQEQCEFVSYFQLEKSAYSKNELELIDEELINPSGRPLPDQIPTINVKETLLYSPDCGIFLTTKPEVPFQGKRTEVTNTALKRMLTGLLLLVVLQMYFLLKQIDGTRTPGQLSNVSSATLCLIAYQDSLVALLFLLGSTFIDELYLIAACVAVVAFVMCGVFELRFIVNVVTTQSNERGTTWWEILRSGSARAASGNEDEESSPETVEAQTPVSTPLPTTAAVPQVAQTTVTLDDESRVFNSIFTMGFSLTIVGTFLILNSFMWRVRYRLIFEYVGLISLNSYWIPQFLRNTLRNRKRSLLWEYVLGTSVVRALPVWYLCLNGNNPLRHHRDPVLAAVFTTWLGFQMGLLYLQELLGARFWLNDKWLPQAYDYHPLLDLKDLENGFASDILASIRTDTATDEDGVVTCKVDCAICMTEIELPVSTSGKKKLSDHSRTKKVMVTPCRHIFHTECLEDWMVYKLQCPVCRNGLPPV